MTSLPEKTAQVDTEKQQLVARIRAVLEERLERLSGAARDARAYATDEDSRAESKYDTRSLEASYLAAGQAQQVEDLAAALRRLVPSAFPDFGEDDPIGPGALVEAELDGDIVFFLLAPGGGGLVTEHLGCELTVVTPDSPLGRRLTGMRSGDSLEQPALTIYAVC